MILGGVNIVESLLEQARPVTSSESALKPVVYKRLPDNFPAAREREFAAGC